MVLVKYLRVGLNKKGGRNNKGKITSYHRGGGKKENYKYINYIRNKLDVPFKILSIENNIYGRKKVGLVGYSDGYLSYMSMTGKMELGEWYVDNDNMGLKKNGNMLMMRFIGLGGIISQIKEKKNEKVKYLRSSGVFGQIISITEENNIVVKLISGELRKFGMNSFAVLGSIKESKVRRTKKAGDLRNRGMKPVVRGVAMNPIDHPHGGRTSRKGETPWGKKTKGLRTRKKLNSIKILKRRNE